MWNLAVFAITLWFKTANSSPHCMQIPKIVQQLLATANEPPITANGLYLDYVTD